MFSIHTYLACVHSDPCHFLPVWSLLSPQKAGPGLFRLKKGRGSEWQGKGGSIFLATFGPSVSEWGAGRGGCRVPVAGRQTKLGEKTTALAKGSDSTGSPVPLWNADCAIFFVKQDSHWVEDKQLFIKRNQELLEKVCRAQHPSGAEEKTIRDPGAAGGPLRSGTGARGLGGFSALRSPLLRAQPHPRHRHRHPWSGTCAWLCAGHCAASEGCDPRNLLMCWPYIYAVYILYIHTYIYTPTRARILCGCPSTKNTLWVGLVILYKEVADYDSKAMLQPITDCVLTLIFLLNLAMCMCVYIYIFK